jgi:hypothetical protein
VSDVFPFGGNCFIDQGFLSKVRERVFRKGFDVVTANVRWVGDEGAVNGRFKLGDEGTEARGEGFEGFDGVVTLHISELFVVGLSRSFKEG